MKYIAIAISMLLLTASVQAATINCYSKGKRIYHGVANEVYLSEGFIIVKYKNYDDVIVRKNKTSPSNCVVIQSKLAHTSGL